MPTPAQLKLIGAAILLALVGAGLWYLYHTGYEAGKDAVQVQWDADKLKQADVQKSALLAYAERINQSEVQHDQDQDTIKRLADVARGMHIHMPACPGASQASADPDGAARLLQQRVDDAFDRFKERVDSLVTRCDQLNIDARRLNNDLGLADEVAKKKMASILEELGK